MTSQLLHPSELAYALSYARANEVIGWGSAPFLPPEGGAGDPATWLTDGESRLREAGRLVGAPESGLNFTDAVSTAVLALVDPSIVFLAERKAGAGLRRLSVHGAGSALVGLSRRPDGMFSLTRYTDLTAAAVACAGFAGAAVAPLDAEARIETDHDSLSNLRDLARAGPLESVAARLRELGAAEADAASAARALSDPAASGVLSALYCANAMVEDAEPFSILTSSDDQTWILFPVASLEGPMVLERSSVGALAARIAVGVAARFGLKG